MIELPSISEIIVVEGRDDAAAVKRAVTAEILITHGYGISRDTWQKMQKAYTSKGIIIFTDPDHAGEMLRKRLSQRFPNAKHAYLSKEEASKAGDVGVENACPENIRRALLQCRCHICEKKPVFSMEDMHKNNLTAGAMSCERRDKLGQILGIGHGNAKAFLNRLNAFGITREEFSNALDLLSKQN